MKINISSISQIYGYLKPYKKWMIYVLIALLTSSFSVLGLSQSIKYVIDYGFVSGKIELLNESLLWFFGIVAVLALSTAFRYYFITMIGERVVSDMRKDIYNNILTLTPEFYESRKVGDIISKLAADTTELQSLIGSSISVALRNVIILSGAIISMMVMNFKLFSMILICIPFVVLPILLFGRKVRKYSKLAQDMLGDITSMAEESIYGIKTIQAYIQEEREHVRFYNKVSQALEVAAVRVGLRAFTTFLVILLIFGSIVSMLWVGGQDVIVGDISPGQLSSFLFLGVLSAGSFGALAEVWGDLQKASGAAERIFSFLEVRPAIVNRVHPVILPYKPLKSLKFENVSFAYPSRPEQKVLENSSFTIEPNKITALLGVSGSGKSTILQLLLRFYDVQGGAIKFDGLDIRDIDLKSLRSQFAYVPQDPVIFSDTIYNNVLYGNQEASKQDVIRALEAASAMEFVSKLPETVNTYLGEKGVRLSGGQKQRVIIARAFLKDPKILLLDEATSALDPENENIIQNAITELMRDRTVVMISHKAENIEYADNVIALSEEV